MRKLRLVSVLFIGALLTGCSNTNDNVVRDTKPLISDFENDDSTLKDEEEQSLLIQIANQISEEQSEESRENEYGYNSNEHVGELSIIDNNEQVEQSEQSERGEQGEQGEQDGQSEHGEQLENDDEQLDSEIDNEENEHDNTEYRDSLEYNISGDSIVYNGTTYDGLYASITGIADYSQYSADTLIKFLLQTYKVPDEIVFTSGGLIDNGVNEEGESDSSNSLHEELSELSYKYVSICNKYGDEANWSILLYTKGYNNVARLVGCKSFTLIIGTDEDIEVDVSNFK